MDNTCNYSDQWQDYIGYDKFEYDIALHNGTILESCYPNAGIFEVIGTGLAVHESEIKSIRFTHSPKIGINDEVSEIPQVIKEKIVVGGGPYFQPYVDMVMPLTTMPELILPKYKKQKGRPVEVRTEPKTGRNKPCPCGSGLKYKKCCLK